MFNDLGLGIAESTEMAKKNAAPKSSRAVPQKTLVAYKGSEAFGAWLAEFAEFLRLPVTNTMDLALKEYAEKSGFPKPMPKRQIR